jgi:hypothetical protein
MKAFEEPYELLFFSSQVHFEKLRKFLFFHQMLGEAFVLTV